MNITLLVIGKTDTDYLKNGIEIYVNRLTHYINFNFEIIPDIKTKKKLSFNNQKKLEGELILKKVKNDDYVILLDEKGKTFTSDNFSKFINKKMVSGVKRLVFIIGGPYGFSEEIYNRGNQKISLSEMTFSHQMVRLIFIEQLYRAFTILKNEPYHHR